MVEGMVEHLLYSIRMTRIAERGSDRIELVATFLRIVETGSLSAAARRLGTTQPTVSRRLQILESWLGLKLLQRTTHAISLTEDGERFYSRATSLMEDWNSLEEEARGAKSTPSGRLRVVVPHAFGQQQMIAPLTEYMRQYPEVTVEWTLHDVEPDFRSSGIDCSVQLQASDDPNTVAVQIAEVPRIAVVAPVLISAGRSVPGIAQLSEIPWVALLQYYRDELFLIHSQSAEERRVPIKTRLYTDNLHALHAAALAGIGACVLSSWLVADDLRQGRLVQLAPDWGAASLPVYIVYPYARYYPAKLRTFVAFMRDCMPQLAGLRAASQLTTVGQGS